MNREDRQEDVGEEFVSIQNVLKNLNLSTEKREINILLLGETGVGKSTFINAFFNYMRFSCLQEAQNENVQVVIPSRFTITDENYQVRVIEVVEEHNESIEIEGSETQACRSYVYYIEGTNLKIRFINTPGIGDTGGIEQDNINFDNVLSFIGKLNHLNAICILLKPNHSRLTGIFEFCIQKLLNGLEKSASQNLIFVLTHTRNTQYRPGETLPSLKKLFETIKGVDILFGKSNIFCTDNECFRFLAALKNDVEFSPDEVQIFEQSWTQSFKECQRMIKYIVGDDDNSGLIPHEVKNTILMNKARRLIFQLPQPLVEIAQLLQDNIRELEYSQINLNLEETKLFELRNKLYIQEQACESAKNLTAEMLNRFSILEREKNAIIKSTAKFACFLKTYPIAPSNDAYEANLKHLIEREKYLNPATNFEMIRQCQIILHEYTSEKTSIMNAITQARDATSVIKPDDIIEAIKSLHSLEIFGAKFKEPFKTNSFSQR